MLPEFHYAAGCAPSTVLWYTKKLGKFRHYIELNEIELGAVTADDIRKYLLWLQENGHNPGGVHGHFRALRAFYHWCEQEFDYTSPIRKVKPPKVRIEPMRRVTSEEVEALLEVCTSKRDKAAILMLYDTGCRAGELLGLNRADVTPDGQVLLRKTKNGMARYVFPGQKTRRALRAYLRERRDKNGALFATKSGYRLTYSGLRGILQRLARRAGIRCPSPHEFRRAYASEMLSAGCYIVTLRRLMGHSSTAVLERYVVWSGGDFSRALSYSPVDRM